MFFVGQKVVCVDASIPHHIPGVVGILCKGEVYTVAKTGVVHPFDMDHLPCIEIIEEHGLHAYWAHRFRPLVERKNDGEAFVRKLKKNCMPKQLEVVKKTVKVDG